MGRWLVRGEGNETSGETDGQTNTASQARRCFEKVVGRWVHVNNALTPPSRATDYNDDMMMMIGIININARQRAIIINDTHI